MNPDSLIDELLAATDLKQAVEDSAESEYISQTRHCFSTVEKLLKYAFAGRHIWESMRIETRTNSLGTAQSHDHDKAGTRHSLVFELAT